MGVFSGSLFPAFFWHLCEDFLAGIPMVLFKSSLPARHVSLGRKEGGGELERYCSSFPDAKPKRNLVD